MADERERSVSVAPEGSNVVDGGVGAPGVGAAAPGAAGAGISVADTDLRAGGLRLPAILMQSITSISPALGLWFVVQFLAGLAGVTAPLAILVGFVLMIMAGAALTQLAKVFPSAGGYYTLISRTVNPRVGFLTGWVFFIYMPMCTTINSPYTGKILEDTFKAHWGFTFPWWGFALLTFAFIAVVAYRGITVSGMALVILGAIEIAVALALGISGLLSPGPGGFNFDSFNPANAPSATGLYLAVVGSVLVLAGWEGALPLAEESENPRRNIPRAIMGSILLLGCLQVFADWGITVGWGTSHMASFVSSSQIPPFVIAQRLWGGAWVLVLLALINSTIALMVACCTASTRVAYGMARSGSLPSGLTKLHPKYKTPTNAITLQLAIMLVVGLGVGFWIGPENEYFTIALAFTLALVVIYSVGSLGVFLYYFRERRGEFRIWLHGVFPLVSSAAFLWVGYKSVVPLPPAPIHWAPVLLAAWGLAGIGVLVYLHRTGRDSWIRRSMEAATERPATAAELAERPIV
jgi:amino acid transporter